jgi:NAD(P)-dependent dehydrogenase (short-subunit alcohol dehydrogenase family)
MGEASQRVALVTGAARGIRLATAKRFLADGWRVVLLDIDDATLKRAHAAIPKSDTIIAIHCDVIDAEAVTLESLAESCPGAVAVNDLAIAQGDHCRTATRLPAGAMWSSSFFRRSQEECPSRHHHWSDCFDCTFFL